MTTTRWWTYLQGLMQGQTQLEAADFIGISKSNITRWKDGYNAKPEFVVKVARAYGANVLEALVAAEFITEDEAKLVEVSPTLDLEQVPTAELALELERRVQIVNHLTAGKLPKATVAGVVDMASKRSKSADDVQPLGYVADDTPTEPEPGDDEYHDGP